MLKRIVRKVSNSLGFDIIRYNITPLDRLFQIFRQIDFHPKHIVDVGANRGTWTRKAIKYFPDAYYSLIEPQQWLKNNFKDLLVNKKINYYAVGAGEKEGILKFTINNSDVSSSFKYTEEEASNLGFNQVDIPVVPLNILLKDKVAPDIIKIDAEGLDIEVLKGANSFFGMTEVFLVEAAVVYTGFKNNILQLMNYMDENGYKLFELTDFNRPPKEKVLWLLELAFIKKGGFIDSYPFEYK